MDQLQMFERLPPTRLFFRCAVPSMVSMAVTSLYTVADGVFVGRFLGAGALAAVNLVMPLVMMAFALADMIAVGSSVQISIRLGEKDEARASRIFSFSALLILLISCAVGLLAFPLAAPLVRLMGADEEATRLAVEYLRVYAAFSPAIMIFFALDNYLRICGKVRYSMMMNVVMSVGNIALDALFIVVFRMGIASAALASCLSLAAGTVVGLAPFLGGRLPLRFVRGRLPLRQVGQIVANGSSEFFSNISASMMSVLMNAVLLHLAGTLAVAAFSVVMYVDSIVKSMLFGMADALQPAISYNFGARNGRRFLALERRLLLAGALLSCGVLLALFLGGHRLIPFFIDGEAAALLQMAERAMRLFSLSYAVSWFGIIASSFFTALGRPALSLAVSFGQTLAFPAACLLALPALWGLDGVWLTALVSGVLTAAVAGTFLALVLARFRKEALC